MGKNTGHRLNEEASLNLGPASIEGSMTVEEEDSCAVDLNIKEREKIGVVSTGEDDAKAVSKVC